MSMSLSLRAEQKDRNTMLHVPFVHDFGASEGDVVHSVRVPWHRVERERWGRGEKEGWEK